MTYPDRISVMTENLDSYAKAFAELENNEKDLGTWAKAFSETSSEDDAKKLYIKLRVEQLDASEPQARPEVNETPSSSTTPPDNLPVISNVQATPQSGSNAKLEFFLKNMPWTDKFAFLLILGVLGHFIGGVTYDLGGSTPLDIYAIVSGQLWLGYVIFPFLVLRLTYAGYFSGLLPDSSGAPKKSQERQNFWLMLTLALVAVIGVMFVFTNYDKSWHAKNIANEPKQHRSTNPSQATANVNGCAYSLKTNDFQVTERSGGSIVKHIASHRFIFVDTGSTTTAIRKAMVTFGEKYEDMCP